MPKPRGVKTSEAIRGAAAELFHRRGYEATTLRQVAAEVGIQVGSLYNHISGKQDLLRWIAVSALENLIDEQVKAVEGVEDAEGRLRAAIETHMRVHAVRARELFIGNSELRSLSRANLREVNALRGRYEATLHELIDAVAAQGRADVLDARLQSYALLAMGEHLASWYRPRSSPSLERVVAVYTQMALRQLDLAGT
ncbi:MAG: TetR/AcrR family transcriptional regulator [Carbonactinosporaceae bacterium]